MLIFVQAHKAGAAPKSAPEPLGGLRPVGRGGGGGRDVLLWRRAGRRRRRGRGHLLERGDQAGRAGQQAAQRAHLRVQLPHALLPPKTIHLRPLKWRRVAKPEEAHAKQQGRPDNDRIMFDRLGNMTGPPHAAYIHPTQTDRRLSVHTVHGQGGPTCEAAMKDW